METIRTIYSVHTAEGKDQKRLLKEFISNMSNEELARLLFIVQTKGRKYKLTVVYNYCYCADFLLSNPNMSNMSVVFAFLYYDLNLGDKANNVQDFAHVLNL